MSDPKARWADFPADLFTLLLIPAFVIISVVVGPQHLWLVLLLIGLFQIASGLLLLRDKKFSVTGWLSLVMGLAAVGAGGFFALTPQ